MAEGPEWEDQLSRAALLWGYDIRSHKKIENMTHYFDGWLTRYQGITDPLMRLGDNFANGAFHDEHADLSEDKLKGVVKRWKDVGSMYLRYGAYSVLDKIKRGRASSKEIEICTEIGGVFKDGDFFKLAVTTGEKLVETFQELQKIFDQLSRMHPDEFGPEGSPRRRIPDFALYVYKMMRMYVSEFRNVLRTIEAGGTMEEVVDPLWASDEEDPEPTGASADEPTSIVAKRGRSPEQKRPTASTIRTSPSRTPEYTEAMASGNATTLTPKRGRPPTASSPSPRPYEYMGAMASADETSFVAKRGRPRDDPFKLLSDSDDDDDDLVAPTKLFLKEHNPDISSSDDDEPRSKGRGFVHLIL